MKKTLLYVLFLMLSGIANAQNVSIPDAAFKNILLNHTPNIDTNSDGEIQVAEAQAATTLNIIDAFANPLGSLEGINAFTNVTTLNLNGYQIASVNLSALTHLTHVTIEGNHILSLDFAGLADITHLEITGHRLDSLNISTLQSLVSLTLNDISLDAIVYDALPALETVLMDNTLVTTLDFRNSPNLRSLSLDGGYGSVDVSGCANLQSLYIMSSDVFPTALSMNGNFGLTSFVFGGEIYNIDLSDYSNLEYVEISIMNAGSDVYINLKNGNATYARLWDQLISIDGPYFCYVCIDEGEHVAFRYSFGNPRVLFSEYCTFFPGGNYNTITGTLTFDMDNNGCDVNDTFIPPLALVQINDGTTTGYSSIGSNGYQFYTQAGTFTLMPNFENDYFNINTETVTFATVDNSTVIQNFCVTANGVHNDVEVVIVPLISAQPGFDAVYKIIYKNKGNQILSGNVSFMYDDAVLDYVFSPVTPSSSATGVLTWNYTDLLPFETRGINVKLNANGPMEIPAVNINDIFNFTAAITPTTGDETPTDNVFNLDQTVIGSYDPNDITCLEGETVHPDKIGEYLHYNINFENTGTAPATFIAVKDVIDTTKYDISTLQVLYASHPMEARVTGNKVEFYFGDINLGASEKGNVTFKIKTLETLTVNSNVTQQADIFFDYNWPIVTNEATTTFAILSTGDFVKDNSVTVSPNPTNGIVNISAKAEIKSVQLYDVQGRLLQAASGTVIDVSNRATGLYFVKVMTAKGMKVGKLIKE